MFEGLTSRLPSYETVSQFCDKFTSVLSSAYDKMPACPDSIRSAGTRVYSLVEKTGLPTFVSKIRDFAAPHFNRGKDFSGTVKEVAINNPREAAALVAAGLALALIASKVGARFFSGVKPPAGQNG